MSLRQNLLDIFKVVGNDKELMRLLYYQTDPLNPTKPDVDTLSNYSAIRKERIIRSPKTDKLTIDAPICRLCMYLGNRGKTNSAPFFDIQDVVFDVYVHIDNFDMNDARSLWIGDRLKTLLHNKSVTGFSKIHSDRMYIIGNPPDGYIGYKWSYQFVSENF